MVSSTEPSSAPLIKLAVQITKAVIAVSSKGSRVVLSCSNYTDVTTTVHQLGDVGVHALRYQGSMSDEEKTEVYQQWLSMEDSIAIVATDAFGLGT